MRRLVRSITAFSLCAALAGCASQQDVLRIREELDETKTRLLKTEKEMGAVRAEAKDEVEKTIKLSRQDIETIRKGAADLQASLEGMRVDLQVLTGKIEDVTLLAKKPADDLTLLKEDLERKLAASDSRGVQLTREVERIALLAEKLEENAKKAEAAELQKPQNLYQSALAAMKGKDFPRAREMFTQFLQLHPAHELAANSRYWLGETYYEEKKFEQAILEFQEVVKSYPGKDKSAAALLKQAMAFHELGDPKSARYLLKKVSDDYPLSDEAKRAKEKLKDIK